MFVPFILSYFPTLLQSIDAVKDAIEKVSGVLSTFGFTTEQIQDIKIILDNLVEAVFRIFQVFSSTSPS
jgi:hypothetical protein